MEGPGISTQLLGHLFFYIHTHSLGLDELLSVLWFEQSSEEFQICISSLDLSSELGGKYSPNGWMSYCKFSLAQTEHILVPSPLHPPACSSCRIFYLSEWVPSQGAYELCFQKA